MLTHWMLGYQLALRHINNADRTTAIGDVQMLLISAEHERDGATEVCLRLE